MIGKGKGKDKDKGNEAANAELSAKVDSLTAQLTAIDERLSRVESGSTAASSETAQ